MSTRLALQKISKHYPGCKANDEIDLSIDAGEIKAVLGENGAGKSTLMKIIYGLVKPDRGELFWQGEAIRMKDPAHARSLGIGMVFQHFSLFESLTVCENIALTMTVQEAGVLSELSQRIKEVSEHYGMALEPDRPVHTLSTGERQRVEIVRCLLQDIKLLILDEPTSVLTPQEVEALFATLRQLAEEGVSILFISHKLNEVRALCHSAVILRGGRMTGRCDPQEESTASIARMMVGADTPLVVESQKKIGTDVLLKVQGLSLLSDAAFGVNLADIGFELKAGEILGVAGVAGNGQEELLRVLSGESRLSGKAAIQFQQKPIAHLRPDQRRALGMGFVPEERLGRGAVPSMSLSENALLTGFLHNTVKNGLIRFQALGQWTDEIIEQFSVKCNGRESEAKSLSGGNLQKFIIGREILQSPQVLIAAHPTWGVDIGAARIIHDALLKLRDEGAAILIVSEDIDELFQISDRIAALYSGRLSPLAATTEMTTEQLGSWMAGSFLHEEAA